MKELLKYGAIAGGLYLLYRQFFGTQTAAPAASSPAASAPAAAAAAATTRGLLLAANPGPSNYHVWGYFYAQVRGVPAPAPESVGMGDGARIITVDEFLAAIGAAGMSGLGNWRRV